MSTVTLTPQALARTGVTPTRTAAGASPLLNTSDTFVFNNTGKELLAFQKSGAGACTVTIDTPNTVDGLAVAQRTVSVGATTGDVMIGPFPVDTYNTPGTSTFAGFTLSEVTGLTCAILRM